MHSFVVELRRTHQYQIDDLIRVEFGQKRAVEPCEEYGRRDRILEMTSRACQPCDVLFACRDEGMLPTRARSRSP